MSIICPPEGPLDTYSTRTAQARQSMRAGRQAARAGCRSVYSTVPGETVPTKARSTHRSGSQVCQPNTVCKKVTVPAGPADISTRESEYWLGGCVRYCDKASVPWCECVTGPAGAPSWLEWVTWYQSYPNIVRAVSIRARAERTGYACSPWGDFVNPCVAWHFDSGALSLERPAKAMVSGLRVEQLGDDSRVTPFPETQHFRP